MISFAEFTRLRWLQLSTARLILTPLVFVAILIFIEITTMGNFFAETVYGVSYTLYFFMVIVAGSRNAQLSLRSEMSQNTWITQQMTALTATEMAIGKLFGATIFNWYSAAWLLVALSISGIATSSIAETHYNLTLLLLTTLLCHIFSLLSQTESQWSQKLGGGLAWLIFVVIFGQIMLIADEVPADLFIPWWSLTINYHSLIIITMSLYCLWGAIGLIRSFMSLLQYKTGPGVWTLFLIFNCVFFCGFVHLPEYAALVQLLFCFSMLTLATYCMAFIEPHDPLLFKRWYRALINGELRNLYFATPRWIPSLIGMFLVAFIIPAFMPSTDVLTALKKIDVDLAELMRHVLSGFAPMAITAYVLRDLGLLFLIRNRKKNLQRADLTFIITMGIIYMLIPGLFAATGASALFPLCFIDVRAHPFVMLGIPVIEACFVMGLLWRQLAPLLLRK